jgi:hypothetical protein
MFSGPSVNPQVTAFSARRAGSATERDSDQGLTPVEAADRYRPARGAHAEFSVTPADGREQDRPAPGQGEPRAHGGSSRTPAEVQGPDVLPPAASAERLAAETRVRAAPAAADASNPYALRDRLQSALVSEAAVEAPRPPLNLIA